MEQNKKSIPKTWIVFVDEYRTHPFSDQLKSTVGSQFKDEDGFIYEIISVSFNKFFEVKFLYAKKVL